MMKLFNLGLLLSILLISSALADFLVVPAGWTDFGESTRRLSVINLDGANPDAQNLEPFPTLAHPLASVALSDDKALSCGGILRMGAGDIRPIKECYSLSLTSKPTWSLLGELSEVRSKPGAIQLKSGKIWFVGGTDMDAALSSTELISLGDDGGFLSEAGKSLPDAISTVCVTRLDDDRIFISGWADGDRLQKAYIYSESQDEFTTVTLPNNYHIFFVCGILNANNGAKYVVMAGGYELGKVTDKVTLYNVADGSVNDGPKLPFPLNSASYSEAAGNAFYVMGGRKPGPGTDTVTNFQVMYLNADLQWVVENEQLKETVHGQNAIYFTGDFPGQ